MRKKSILNALFIFCCLVALNVSAACPAWADPPEDVVLQYDLATQTLTVTITHKSFFTGLHYAKRVQISRNKELVEEKEYDSQPGKKVFAYTYKIPAAVNDALEVTVFCNLHGKKIAALTIGETKP